MGFFNKLLGKQKELPELESSSNVAKRMDHFRRDIESLAKDVDDRLEVVPADDAAYVFIGKPPKKFGIAWIKDGKVNNLKTLAQEKGVPELKIQIISEKLRSAYEKSDDANRFTTKVADHEIVVTDSSSLQQELRRIIR